MSTLLKAPIIDDNILPKVSKTIPKKFKTRPTIVTNGDNIDSIPLIKLPKPAIISSNGSSNLFPLLFIFPPNASIIDDRPPDIFVNIFTKDAVLEKTKVINGEHLDTL